MSRYRACPEADPPCIERLPRGTSRTEGHTFAEAKRDLLAAMRGYRDTWEAACTMARGLTRERLSIADLVPGVELAIGTVDERDDEPEHPTIPSL